MRVKVLLITFLLGILSVAEAQIKIGIIGLDTSHAIAFTKFLNGVDKKEEFKDFKIVAAYPYGSKTIKSSSDRIPGYIDQVKELGVEIVPSIEALLKKVDCVMLETNDGNMHLEQALEVFKAGKIMFIDKPLGATLAQSIAIYQLAKDYNVPIFSSSALRFVPQNQKLRNGDFGKILGADCYSPATREITHPDFGWYGIHGVETLFTVMGTGCISVNRMSSEGTDVVVGLWNDGRIGTFRGQRTGKGIYGGTAFTDKGSEQVGPYQGYEVLLVEILNFFKTRVAPVSEAETLEIFTFMEASNESKRKEGKIILMEDTYRKGLKESRQLLQELKEKK
ncbi:MAG: Gfo/Idh/MocA family oxidoreductase [Dysgonamonadaceae bacterium]|jgi:predicted dehydrogenase|nr:Gfo/Idh/MocA family oxidoreductase [Dysgonamonadaceae bacterium]MDD3310207.1 Gfo/Idh/MocA family oxidoreductase [Dysgonamonadaceae bacterium]MDD3900618.1 Gfo/Idh/MocA family oxidoreductase [Dysgonamonadaceae bacterium]MDD4399078.1 Gfo/Idh/MocA family oxidoreductase [Dysgonamonadaceae bacterium]